MLILISAVWISPGSAGAPTATKPAVVARHTFDGGVATAVPAGLTIGNPRPLRVGGPDFSNSSGLYHGRPDDVYAILD